MFSINNTAFRWHKGFFFFCFVFFIPLWSHTSLNFQDWQNNCDFYFNVLPCKADGDIVECHNVLRELDLKHWVFILYPQ